MKERDEKWLYGVEGAEFVDDSEEFEWLAESVTTDQLPEPGRLAKDKQEISMWDAGSK